MIESLKQFFAALIGGNTVEVIVGLKPVITEDAGKANAGVQLTADQAKARLVELLSNPKYRFRSVGTLSKAIGADRWKTEEYLAEIGSRPSRRNPNLFGLTARVGQRQFA